MSNRDIVQHLEQAQRDARENKAIEEIPQSELDRITGAGPGWFTKIEFNKRR